MTDNKWGDDGTWGSFLWGGYDAPAAGEQGEEPHAKPDTVFLSQAPAGAIADLLADLGQQATDLSNETTYAEETGSSRTAITYPRCLEAELLMDTTGSPDGGVILEHSGASVTVQRGTTDFGADEDSLAVTITTVGALTSAFVRITGVCFNTGGPTAGCSALRKQDDVGVTVAFTDVSTITFTRYSAATNEDYRVEWEVWEYTGPADGADEFIVRYTNELTLADGVAQLDQEVTGISTLGDCIPFITGIRHEADAQYLYDRAFCTATMINDGDDKVRLDRGDSTDETITSVAVVEFTGSNWVIENNITHAQAGAGDETENINDVGAWTNAFIEGSMRNPNGFTLRSHFLIRPGAITTQVRFYVDTRIAGQEFVVHVAKNSSITVEHLDSITGGATTLPAGAANPQTVNETITSCTTDETAVIAYASPTAAASTPRAHWTYYISSATNLRWWRSWSGISTEWAAQIIQFPRVSASTFSLAVTNVGPSILTAFQDNASLGTLTIPTNGTTDRVQVMWSVEWNPLTTSASDICISTLAAYNRHGNEWAMTTFTHATPITSDDYDFTVKARRTGASVFSGDILMVRVGEAHHDTEEMCRDWVTPLSAPTLTADTRCESLVPTSGSGFGDDGAFVHQHSVAAAAVRQMDMRLTSPLVNELYPWQTIWRQVLDPDEWGIQPPGVLQAERAGKPDLLMLPYCFYCPCPSTFNKIHARVQVNNYTVGGTIRKLEIRCYSMNRLPVIGGLVAPGPPPIALDAPYTEASTTTDHGGGSGGEWLDLGLGRIARDHHGGTWIALSFRIHEGSVDTDARFTIRAITVDAARVDETGAGTPDEFTIGDP
jgi:hypothetical protein